MYAGLNRCRLHGKPPIMTFSAIVPSRYPFRHLQTHLDYTGFMAVYTFKFKYFYIFSGRKYIYTITDLFRARLLVNGILMLILYSCSGWSSEAGLEVDTSHGTSI